MEILFSSSERLIIFRPVRIGWQLYSLISEMETFSNQQVDLNTHLPILMNFFVATEKKIEHFLRLYQQSEETQN